MFGRHVVECRRTSLRTDGNARRLIVLFKLLLVKACRQPGVIIAGQAQLSPSRLCSKPAAGLISRANSPAGLFLFLFVGFFLQSAARNRIPFRHRWAPLIPAMPAISLQVSGSRSVGIRLSPCRHPTGSRASPGRAPTPQASLLNVFGRQHRPTASRRNHSPAQASSRRQNA